MIKIVITRPADAARSTIELAREMGFHTISFPLLRLGILKTIDLKKDPADYDWLLFTSSNAVRYFIAYCGENKISLTQQFKIAAVGPTTEKTITSFGLRPDFIPISFNRTAVSEQMPVNKGERILYPTLQEGPNRIETILKSRGCFVDRIDVYKSETIFYSEQEWQELADEKAQVITFFSPRTVGAFFRNKQKAVPLDDYTLAALAESSAEELIKHHHPPQITCDVPKAENLLQKIKDYYA